MFAAFKSRGFDLEATHLTEPERLEKLLRRMLAKDRDERFASAAEVAADRHPRIGAEAARIRQPETKLGIGEVELLAPDSKAVEIGRQGEAGAPVERRLVDDDFVDGASEPIGRDLGPARREPAVACLHQGERALDEQVRRDVLPHRAEPLTLDIVDTALLCSREEFAPRRLGELIPDLIRGEYPDPPIDCGV